MRKRFLHDEYGKNDHFWDLNWANRFNQATLPLYVDERLARRLRKHLPKDSLILEGGCGDCQYLRHFHAQGYAAVGIDFAKNTVQEARKVFPDLDIREGDIRNLDFVDDTFDAYYSGGVIEHFEDGLTPQLREAHRVLKPGGLFFVTVPHLNLARRLQAMSKSSAFTVDMDGRSSFHMENVSEFKVHTPPEDYHFHEYVLDTAEMRRHLGAAGFTIIDEMAFSSIWGLMDLGWFQILLAPRKPKRNWSNRAFGGILRLVSTIEKAKGLLPEAAGSLLGECTGNMKLYVCTAVKSLQLANPTHPRTHNL